MSHSGNWMVLAPVLGAAVAATIGFFFDADAEIIVVVLCIAAVFGVWINPLVSSRASDERQQDDVSEPTAEERNLRSDDLLIQSGPVLNALPIGVLIINDTRRVVAANASIREIFALPGGVGYPVETLRAQRLLKAVDEVRDTGLPADFEMTLSRRSDVTLQVHVRAMTQGTSGEPQIVIAAQDITKARMADEVHRDFVANASHELKTPLAVVSGLIETLQGPARNDPVGTERFLNRLATQTQRMTRLIDDLMSLNRIELNERVMPQAPQNLASLVGETVDALRPAAEATNVEMIFVPGDSSPMVLAEREELGQLFGNLIDNAIKYGGSGKSVEISTFGSEDGREIGVSVADQGPGIAREHLPRLTERFYRVDIGRSREQGGTGLGLAICKHIVNRHRGRLDVQSTVGEGTIFTVWLPCISPSNGESPGQASA